MNVLLSSGGLDSAVIAATVETPLHLFVDYGQRAADHERRASSRIAAEYAAARHEVVIDGYDVLAPSVLTGMPGFSVGTDTVVPNRNAMLISIGVALAQSTGGGIVYLGCNADDHATYPDCRPDFLHAASELAKMATGGAVTVQAPLSWLTKSRIGDIAREYSVPVDDTWSCYTPAKLALLGADVQCGNCNACLGRKAAGVHDH